jgi:hypothetical protein
MLYQIKCVNKSTEFFKSNQIKSKYLLPLPKHMLGLHRDCMLYTDLQVEIQISTVYSINELAFIRVWYGMGNQNKG